MVDTAQKQNAPAHLSLLQVGLIILLLMLTDIPVSKHFSF